MLKDRKNTNDKMIENLIEKNISNNISENITESKEIELHNLEEGKKIYKANKNKSIILTIILIIMLIILLITLFNYTYNKLLNKKMFEKNVLSFIDKNQKVVFSINKIIFFSSSDAKSKVSTATNFTIENLYTYTDIALFINNNSEENTLENTLKNIKISNIKITKKPLLGKPDIYFKSINNFAKSDINEENKISNELEFEVTQKNDVDLNQPIIYNNCANPITISYINQNIKNDYTITDVQNPITYSGKLLKRCGISLDEISTAVSFSIEIENAKNQMFKTTIYFEIPYKSENSTILDGSIKLEQETKFNFYRYK